MYYWDLAVPKHLSADRSFSSCQKNVLLGRVGLPDVLGRCSSFQQLLEECTIGTGSALGQAYLVPQFQQLLEECTIGTSAMCVGEPALESFSSCQKNVLLGPQGSHTSFSAVRFQQLLEECTIGTQHAYAKSSQKPFQQLLEECTIGTPNATG